MNRQRGRVKRNRTLKSTLEAKKGQKLTPGKALQNHCLAPILRALSLGPRHKAWFVDTTG